MRVSVVNIIPNARSGETNQDSEPNIAVNPANPAQIVGTAFTPDPMGGPNAPIYVSSDGGSTWVLNSIVPSQDPQFGTGDITVSYSGTGQNLYAGILRRPSPSLRLNILRTNNPMGPNPMTVLVDRTGANTRPDQPYIQATTTTTNAGTLADRVYVGNNDRPGAGGGMTATIDQHQDAANATPPPPAGFTINRIETRANSLQNGPQIRPAIHPDGTVYGLFYGWRNFTGTMATSDVVAVRDDNWGAGPNPFTALTDPSDNLAGRLVVTGRNVPWSTGPTLGQERIGGSLSIAVDPADSDVVYIVWADRVGTTDYTLHVRRSTDRGATWSAADLQTITNALNPALAINDRGQLGFLYQQVTGAGANQRWVTHFEITDDDWATAPVDLVLANVPANAPAPAFFPYIGDYADLTAVGDDFYGIFSANNTPDNNNFPNGVVYQRNADFEGTTLLDLDEVTPVPVSIDPFFFRVCDVQNAGGSVLRIAECCLNKRAPLSLKEDIFGVYANDNPQNRSLRDQLDLIQNTPFVRLALVTIQGANPTLQRDLDNANLIYQNECNAWVYCHDAITVDRPDLLVLDQDDCNGNGHSVSAEEDDLFDLGRTLGAEIVGYYIDTSNGGFVGCAAHPPGRRGFWVGTGASPWTFAHELTHVVGDNGHMPGDQDNLMYTPTADIEHLPPDLTNNQCNRILDDPDMDSC